MNSYIVVSLMVILTINVAVVLGAYQQDATVTDTAKRIGYVSIIAALISGLMYVGA